MIQRHYYDNFTIEDAGGLHLICNEHDELCWWQVSHCCIDLDDLLLRADWHLTGHRHVPKHDIGRYADLLIESQHDGTFTLECLRCGLGNYRDICQSITLPELLDIADRHIDTTHTGGKR